MKNWWQQLQLREQRMILVGGGLGALISFYVLIWSPFAGHLQSLRQQATSQQQLLQWMRVSSRQIAVLKGEGYGRKPLGNHSLLTAADASISAAHLSIFVTKIAETENNQVTIVFDEVPFDQMLKWLTHIWRNFGLASTQISVTPKKTLGLVQAQLTLQLK